MRISSRSPSSRWPSAADKETRSSAPSSASSLVARNAARFGPTSSEPSERLESRDRGRELGGGGGDLPNFLDGGARRLSEVRVAGAGTELLLQLCAEGLDLAP